MTRFLSHHELENLYYLLGKHEQAYHQLIEYMDAYPNQEHNQKLQSDLELAKQIQQQLLSKLT
ncbi:MULTISPECIES: hypothetical protein [Oceanobacillus]|uniref:Uncharacterized protein n=1 Tax=Oceanobacillus kimchii TaxID=746691 RepID=A0ABQ5TJ55_9BACI|nr:MULTISPECIES: hypothetical protein [Oceanobacillus]MBT2600757.1 hypothetical protein [Oceanobacillus sp. ISL-74]MBT2650846.1 hypothetical protein [Oceanobacillus sp. ISL-73]MCT1575512.1 hypothetical protein [Oceanobacillus kimchii]MCT2137143.1 hypothetical protein [Oceanobacillus kimchii]GLO66909.1 hypothetical protein MACH08_26930 [Oceanobacillus kimchii]